MLHNFYGIRIAGEEGLRFEVYAVQYMIMLFSYHSELRSKDGDVHVHLAF
jgi:hypothetical protein